MSDFGLYFGTEVINLTEVKGKRLITDISLPNSAIRSVLEQKKPDFAKAATLLRNEFETNELSPTNACVAIAGENLIIRTFDLPMFLSRRELDYDTITFEVRKYIPFKIEDLVFDYRFFTDRKDKKVYVLFVGIKKESLDLYLSFFGQSQIKARLIEYAGYSVMRLLKLNGISDKGVFGLLNADSEEETNFLVFLNGFPLFSRDISLILGAKPEAKPNFIGKLKSEVRISLDFFRRKFPTKALERVIILCAPNFQEEITSLINDLGLSPIVLRASKFLSRDTEFKPTLAKSYAVAIGTSQRLPYSINFLRPAIKKEKAKIAISMKALPISIAAVKINTKVVWIAFLMIFLSAGWSWLRRAPLENELKLLKTNQPKIEDIVGSSTYAVLSSKEQEFITNTNNIKTMLKNRFYLTTAMNVIPQILPEGAWLTGFDYALVKDEFKITLDGVVYLGNQDKEFAAVNEIVIGLRDSSEFNQRFKEIKVISMDRDQLGEEHLEATRFQILCRSQK